MLVRFQSPDLASRHENRPTQAKGRLEWANGRVEKLRYMHRDPVKQGLVQEPEKWSWSSFRYYKYGEVGLVRVNDCDLMRMSVRCPAA